MISSESTPQGEEKTALFLNTGSPLVDFTHLLAQLPTKMRKDASIDPQEQFVLNGRLITY